MTLTRFSQSGCTTFTSLYMLCVQVRPLVAYCMRPNSETNKGIFPKIIKYYILCVNTPVTIKLCWPANCRNVVAFGLQECSRKVRNRDVKYLLHRIMIPNTCLESWRSSHDIAIEHS
jgi:hypothetical protein